MDIESQRKQIEFLLSDKPSEYSSWRNKETNSDQLEQGDGDFENDSKVFKSQDKFLAGIKEVSAYIRRGLESHKHLFQRREENDK